MSYSEIILAPNSGRTVTLNLKDKAGLPINFTVGTWQATLVITDYPMFTGTPYATLTTPGVIVPLGPAYEWLTLSADSVMTLTPLPTVTSEWRFTRQHYDCFVKGPNVNSLPDRVAHGPFIMDW